MSIDTGGVANATRAYTVFITRDPEDIVRAQRLRYRVFAEECGAYLAGSATGLDSDEFDVHCDHLLVSEVATGNIVGTYRLLPPGRSKMLYSQTEFDLTALAPLRTQIVEAGRACVDPEHRDGTAISTLWSGIAGYLRQTGLRYLIGCYSLPLGDAGATAAAVWDRVQAKHLSAQHFRVRPFLPWDSQGVPRADNVPIPPLLRGYLRLGAQVCGPAAYDPDFGTADLLLLLDLAKTNPRYLTYYGLAPRT